MARLDTFQQGEFGAADAHRDGKGNIGSEAGS